MCTGLIDRELVHSTRAFCKRNSKFVEFIVDALLFATAVIITIVGKVLCVPSD
jgi:hypothetical protein